MRNAVAKYPFYPIPVMEPGRIVDVGMERGIGRSGVENSELHFRKVEPSVHFLPLVRIVKEPVIRSPLLPSTTS